jgi:hypothetical protein
MIEMHQRRLACSGARFGRLLVAAVCLLAAACGGSATAGNTATGQPSVAEKLNVIDGHASAAQYQRALDALRLKCREPETRLADYTVKTQQIIESKTGEKEPLIGILTHTNQSIPKSLGKTRCLDIFAAYATLRTGG